MPCREYPVTSTVLASAIASGSLSVRVLAGVRMIARGDLEAWLGLAEESAA